MNIEQKIEALLFYQNEPVEIKKIAKFLSASEDEVSEGLKKLSSSLKSRGLILIATDKEASLAAAPEMRGLLEQITKDEMSADIGKAGLETLAIILYNGPVSRREIDYIRGVNSTFILRNLAMRGLIEKSDEGGRSYKYKATISLLSHLGIGRLEELPEFEDYKKKLEAISADDGGE